MDKSKMLRIYLRELSECEYICVIADRAETELILLYIKNRTDFVVHCKNGKEYHFFISFPGCAIFVDVEIAQPGYDPSVLKVSPMV